MNAHSKSDNSMQKGNTTYRYSLALALASSIFLLVLIGAVGVIGVEGDRFDLVYFGVVAIGIVAAIITRFRPRGMAIALFSMATAQALVAVMALIIGKQHVEVSSVTEILGLNGFFVALFLGPAMLFLRAARESVDASKTERD
ncbi:MAG: hypothetical protein O2971_04140 [Proteobacteria bacterium]|nr:hypothetical protein [Pseudomonadota bacterium]